MKHIYVISEDSPHYSWEAYADTPEECLGTFKLMWLRWCLHSGGDTDYWGKKFEDVTARKVRLGSGYQDREEVER